MQTLLDQFDHLTQHKDKHFDPEWLATMRANAYKTLKKIGFPTPKDELWKYTSIRDLLDQSFALPSDNFKLEDNLDLKTLPIIHQKDSIKIVIINGVVSTKHSNLSDLPKGCNLICYPEDAAEHTFDLIADHDEQTAYHQPASFNLLNMTLFPEIVHFSVEEDATIAPVIEFCFIHQADSHSHCYTSSPRLNIHLGEKSACKIIENHITVGQSQSFINAHTQIYLSRKANFERYVYQNCNRKSFVFSHGNTQIDDKAHLTEFTFNRGGKTIRQENLTRFIGKKASCHIAGAALLEDDQHADTTLYVDHTMPKCESRQTFKNVLKDHAESVFQGKIHVTPNAQGTDGFQLNKALLLSENATANAKPELEIYADDVKCSHGSTSGFLAEDDLFYLTSRGIPEDEAARLLITAFLEDTLDEIKDETIKESFKAVMVQTLKASEDAHA